MKFDSLDFEIYLGGLFEKCKTEENVEWLKEQMEGCVDLCASERMDEIER